MNSEEISAIKLLIDESNVEISKIKKDMKVSLKLDNLCTYKYEDKIIVKYNNRNYYLIQSEEEAFSLETIEVKFLFEKENNLIESDSFHFYSFGSIIKSCTLLHMKKPLILIEKIGKSCIYKRGLDKKYQKNLFFQLNSFEIIKNIFIIDLFENQSYLKIDTQNIIKYKYNLKFNNNQILSKYYKYENKFSFYEYFNTFFLDIKEDNIDINDKKDNEFLFVCNKERKNLIEFLISYFNRNTDYNILYLLGPMSAGKTTTLIHFKNLSLYPILYLNLKTINSLEPKERLNFFIKETLLFFNDIESQSKFFENYDEKLDINKTILIIIKNLINKNKNFRLIIDQYKTKYDLNGDMKRELISIFNNNMDNRFLLCSSINDLENRNFILKNIYGIIDNNNDEKSLNNIKVKYINRLFYLNKSKIKCSKEKQLLLKEFNYLPRISNKILNLDENALNDFKEKEKEDIIKKINDFLVFNNIGDDLFFNSFFEWREYRENEENIKEDKFKNIIKYLPLKYFDIKNKDEEANDYEIESIFPLIEDIIEEMFIKRVYDLLIKINKLPEGLKGYVFEYSVILSIETKYKNIIRKKVKNIYQLNSDQKNKLNFNTDSIYSIRQTNFYGSFYDFALYFGKIKKLVLFQITLHKKFNDITSINLIQKNCEEIMSNINIKNKKIISENDIFFYYIIPNIEKDGDEEYNKKMKYFINDLNKYKFQYLEYDIDKNDFKNYILNLEEKSNSKVFNNRNPIIEEFNFNDKKKSLELNILKLECNKNFLGKKYHRANQLKEIENESINYFNNNKIIYKRFISYCNISKEEIPIIINKKIKFNDIFLEKSFILVLKDEDEDFCIINRKGGKVEIYSLQNENPTEFNFSDILNHNSFCLFQIILKRNLNAIDTNEMKNKNLKKKK